MVRLLVSYGVSALIALLFFTLMYNSVFNTYGGGRFESLGNESEVMEMLFWPVIPKLLLGLALLYLIVVFPLSWVSTKKFSEKKMISLCLFFLAGVVIAGVSLMSVEPIIATDYFEYGERQELNKVLEAVGYGYTNMMIYLCAVVLAISAWAITQVQFKSVQD